MCQQHVELSRNHFLCHEAGPAICWRPANSFSICKPMMRRPWKTMPCLVKATAGMICLTDSFSTCHGLGQERQAGRHDNSGITHVLRFLHTFFLPKLEQMCTGCTVFRKLQHALHRQSMNALARPAARQPGTLLHCQEMSAMNRPTP